MTLYGNDSAAPALHNAGFTVLLRPWLPDCPTQSLPAVDSARARVDAALYAIGDTPYDWLVLSNECVWRDVDYAQTWIKEAIHYAAARGVTRLVPVVWSPGRPDLDAAATLATAYDDAPIPVAWGVNLYPVEPGRDLSAHGGISEYTVWRWRLYRHLLPDDVPIIVTEAARGDGAQPPDFADIGRFWVEVNGEFVAVTLWYISQPAGLGHWPLANLRGRLGELGENLTP